MGEVGLPEGYEIHRDWWMPLVVTLWRRTPLLDGEDWRRGPYQTWRKRGDFFRRSTAARFAWWEATHG